MKRFLFVFTLFTASLAGLNAQNITAEVMSSFEAGDASSLSTHFNSNVELIIDGPGKIYNKNQAEMIMNSFFSKNNPNSFSKIHQGDKDSSIFFIGQLETNGKSYRVSILMKKSSNTFLIHQIRIQDV